MIGLLDVWDIVASYAFARLLLWRGRLVAAHGGPLVYTLEYDVKAPFTAKFRVRVRRLTGVWRWVDGSPFPPSLAYRLERRVRHS
jgi:hypothetical protein